MFRLHAIELRVPGERPRHADKFPNWATLQAAGSQTVSLSDGPKSGTIGAIAVSAGAFTKLLLLVPGETAAPGSPTGRPGLRAQRRPTARGGGTCQAR